MAESSSEINRMPARKEKMAVVILNWNGEGFLRRFLPGVVECSTPILPDQCDVSVVVADNASADGSVAYMREAFAGDQLTIIEFAENYGFTGGYNRALAHPSLADCDYFLLLNSDVEVTPGWLLPLVDIMQAQREVAAVMPKLRSYDQRDYFEYAGACGGFIDLLGYPFCRGRIIGTVEADRGQYDTVRDLFWATGAAMLVRAPLWRQLGGLDENFFAHMEEIDLCWRLKRLGHRIVVQPESVVYHVGGGALPASSPRKTYFNFRNNLAMLYKNLPLFRFAIIYCLRFGIDMTQAVGYSLLGRFSFAGAIVRGHRDFWGFRRRLERKPEYGFSVTHPVAGIPRRESGVYRGSVVLRYLFGRRTFGKMM